MRFCFCGKIYSKMIDENFKKKEKISKTIFDDFFFLKIIPQKLIKEEKDIIRI